jgi:hypothetical protein
MIPLLVLSSNALIRAKAASKESVKIYGARGIKCARSRPYIIRRGDVILTVVEEVAMILENGHRFGAIRTLVLVGFFPIGLLTSTAVP